MNKKWKHCQIKGGHSFEREWEDRVWEGLAGGKGKVEMMQLYLNWNFKTYQNKVNINKRMGCS